MTVAFAAAYAIATMLPARTSPVTAVEGRRVHEAALHEPRLGTVGAIRNLTGMGPVEGDEFEVDLRSAMRRTINKPDCCVRIVGNVFHDISIAGASYVVKG